MSQTRKNEPCAFAHVRHLAHVVRELCYFDPHTKEEPQEEQLGVSNVTRWKVSKFRDPLGKCPPMKRHRDSWHRYYRSKDATIGALLALLLSRLLHSDNLLPNSCPVTSQATPSVFAIQTCAFHRIEETIEKTNQSVLGLGRVQLQLLPQLLKRCLMPKKDQQKRRIEIMQAMHNSHAYRSGQNLLPRCQSCSMCSSRCWYKRKVVRQTLVSTEQKSNAPSVDFFELHPNDSCHPE